MSAKSESSCEVCGSKPFKYTCPTCEILYCSLKCYQVHGSSCTETFHKANVESLLVAQKPTEQEARGFARHLHEIHQNMNERDEPAADSASSEESLEDENDEDESYEAAEGSDRDEEVGIGADRIAELQDRATRGELQFEDLTPAELQLFESALKRGVVQKFVVPTQHWWQYAASAVEVDPKAVSPPHVCCSESGTKRYNSLVVHSAMNFLFAYIYTLRSLDSDSDFGKPPPKSHKQPQAQFGQEERVDVGGACFCLLQKLEHGGKPKEYLEEILQESLAAVTAAKASKDTTGNVTVLAMSCWKDVCNVTKNHHAVDRMFREAKNLLKWSEFGMETQGDETARILKKVNFLRSVCWYHRDDANRAYSALEVTVGKKESLTTAPAVGAKFDDPEHILKTKTSQTNPTFLM